MESLEEESFEEESLEDSPPLPDSFDEAVRRTPYDAFVAANLQRWRA